MPPPCAASTSASRRSALTPVRAARPAPASETSRSASVEWNSCRATLPTAMTTVSSSSLRPLPANRQGGRLFREVQRLVVDPPTPDQLEVEQIVLLEPPGADGARLGQIVQCPQHVSRREIHQRTFVHRVARMLRHHGLED